MLATATPHLGHIVVAVAALAGKIMPTRLVVFSHAADVTTWRKNALGIVDIKATRLFPRHRAFLNRGSISSNRADLGFDKAPLAQTLETRWGVPKQQSKPISVAFLIALTPRGEEFEQRFGLELLFARRGFLIHIEGHVHGHIW
jgi:hypothetical protein